MWTFVQHCATVQLMTPKDDRIAVRVSADLKRRLVAVAAKTGVDEATIVRNSIQALIDHAEKFGEIRFPIKLEAPQQKAKPTYPDRADEGSVVEDKPRGKKTA